MQGQTSPPPKKKLFNRYSMNLGFYRPDLKERFVCPQCMRSFGRDVIERNLLSEEHIPPRAVGHQLITLTCKQCNSWSGRELESHLATHFQIQDFQRGEWSSSSSQTMPRVEAGNGEIGASIELKKGKILIVGRKDHSNPELRRKLDRYLQSVRGKKEWQFRFHVKFQYSHSRFLVAILRSAYLIMFAYFGYGYIFDPGLEQVRQQINNPDGFDLAKYAVLKVVEHAPLPDYVQRGVGLVTSPPNLRSFSVALTLNRDRPEYWGVLMPGPSEEGAQVYEECKKVSDLKSVDFHSVSIPYKPEDLTNINLKGWLRRIWLELDLPMS